MYDFVVVLIISHNIAKLAKAGPKCTNIVQNLIIIIVSSLKQQTEEYCQK